MHIMKNFEELKEAARELKEDIADKLDRDDLRELADKVKDKAADIYDDVKDKASDLYDDVKDELSEHRVEWELKKDELAHDIKAAKEQRDLHRKVEQEAKEYKETLQKNS